MGEEQQERTSVGVIGIASHNHRVVQIKRFIMFPPLHGVHLRLVPADSPDEVLGSWTREQCTADRGETIPDLVSTTVEEHAAAMESEVLCLLGWAREDVEQEDGSIQPGAWVQTKRLRARRPRAAPAPRIPTLTQEESEQIVGNGDSQAFVGQVIRTSEVYMRSHLQSHHQQIGQSRELAENALEQARMANALVLELHTRNFELMQQASTFQRENIDLRNENESLKRTIATLLGEDTEQKATESQAESEARAAFIQQAGAGIVKVAPRMWQMVEAWTFQQIQKAATEQQQRAAAAAAAAAAQKQQQQQPEPEPEQQAAE